MLSSHHLYLSCVWRHLPPEFIAERIPVRFIELAQHGSLPPHNTARMLQQASQQVAEKQTLLRLHAYLLVSSC